MRRRAKQAYLGTERPVGDRIQQRLRPRPSVLDALLTDCERCQIQLEVSRSPSLRQARKHDLPRFHVPLLIHSPGTAIASPPSPPFVASRSKGGNSPEPTFPSTPEPRRGGNSGGASDARYWSRCGIDSGRDERENTSAGGRGLYCGCWSGLWGAGEEVGGDGGEEKGTV